MWLMALNTVSNQQSDPRNEDETDGFFEQRGVRSLQLTPRFLRFITCFTRKVSIEIVNSILLITLIHSFLIVLSPVDL